MSSLKQQVRCIFSLLSALAYLTSLPQISSLVLMTLMHNDHHHEVRVIEHEGHEDLILHHHDDHEENSTHDLPLLNERYVEVNHHHDGDHVFRLSPENGIVHTGDTSIRIPIAIVSFAEITALAVTVDWRTHRIAAQIRPPPVIDSSVHICLRTTILVV